MSKDAKKGAETEESPSAEGVRGPSQGWSRRRRCGFRVAHIRSGDGLAHWSESGSSQAGHQSSDPGEGGASLLATTQTRGQNGTRGVTVE